MNQDKASQLLTIIQKPIITDKSTKLLENNQYCFQVDHRSNKPDIKEAIEYIFNVKVKKVNTYHMPHKKRRVGRFQGYKAHYKRAIITLAPNNTIDLFSEN